MVLGRRWVLKQHFVGAPKHEDFELVEEELPALKENEIMFRRVRRKKYFYRKYEYLSIFTSRRSLFLSVDPYMRPYTARMTTPLPFTMIGSSLAVVEESRHPGHQQGSHIVILAGWVERGVVNPDTMGKV